MTKKEQIEETKEELKKYSAINAVCNTDGGKQIIETLKKDIVSAINDISSKYKTASHSELISLSAKLTERLNLLRVFTRADKNKKFLIKELDELLKEDS